MSKIKKKPTDKAGFKATAKKHNPFEVHINRKKYDVLGKKSKNEKGLPGISRSRAIRKRKATLLQEYKLKGKTNQFVDRRIGEFDPSMTADDKVIARYTTERMKFHSRKSLYNLGDNETLTHRGTSLAEIEKFDDPKSDEDEDDEDGGNRSGKLDKDFVSEAHFGGGMLRKIDSENKSRKDLIDEMIAESKKRKAEQQRLREQTLDLTEKLDTEWRDILPLVTSSKSAKNDEPTLKSDRKYANYDILSKELIFEARGKASDKLKSEAEIAKEEREQLEKMESLRLARMRGEEENVKIKHRSADDLDDGFDFKDDFVPKKKKKVDDSETEVNEETSSSNLAEHRIGNSDDDGEDVSEESESASDEDGDSCSEADATNAEIKEEVEEDSDDSDEDNSEDDLSDLKSSDDDDNDEEEKGTPKKKTRSKAIKAKGVPADVLKEEPLEDKSLNDLPFTLSVPEDYEKFEEICCGKDVEYQSAVVERMVKSNHPSLPDGSREKLINLFAFCLQHLQDIATDNQTGYSSFAVLDRLAPWLYDLMHFDSKEATAIFSEVIKEKYEDFVKRPRRFPSIDTLLFLKLTGILYPTSDYRHRIVTPTILFMQHILNSSRVQSSTDVAVGLFVCTLLLEFTSLSKRFTPEAFNFLSEVFRLSQLQPDGSNQMRSKTKSSFSLHVKPSLSTDNIRITPLGTMDLLVQTDSIDFKLRSFQMALKLLEEFCTNFKEAEEFLIVERFLPFLKEELYCGCFHTTISRIRNNILALKGKKLYKLMEAKKGPKPLKLYEPHIEDVYTFKKKRPMSKEKEEHDKLLYKYKKEVKGALREIRRDNTFLAKLKFTETKASDMERQRKVKEIFGDAAQQAGEINKLKRKKP